MLKYVSTFMLFIFGKAFQRSILIISLYLLLVSYFLYVNDFSYYHDGLLKGISVDFCNIFDE